MNFGSTGSLPAAALGLLEKGSVSIAQVAGAGRGLFAAKDIEIGAVIHTEQPHVCHPALSRRKQVCYHCLAVLTELGRGHLDIGQHLKFCSQSCLQTAEDTYLEADIDGCFQDLEAHCDSTGERFPLLAKRLASSIVAGKASPKDLDFLAFARLPQPPPPEWVRTFSLLQRGLQDWAAHSPDGSLGLAVDQISLDWYLSLIARLHINTFRVDCVFPLEGGLAAAAAAIISGSETAGSSGSALYAAASLFNHSCDPNVSVDFPSNNSKAVLSALRPIGTGEQLCISYLDANLPVSQRRQQLLWAYGFKCGCRRCLEEAQEPCDG